MYHISKQLLLVALCYDARRDALDVRPVEAETVRTLMSEGLIDCPGVGWIPLVACASEECLIAAAQSRPGAWIATLITRRTPTSTEAPSTTQAFR